MGVAYAISRLYSIGFVSLVVFVSAGPDLASTASDSGGAPRSLSSRVNAPARSRQPELLRTRTATSPRQGRFHRQRARLRADRVDEALQVSDRTAKPGGRVMEVERRLSHQRVCAREDSRPRRGRSSRDGRWRRPSRPSTHDRQGAAHPPSRTAPLLRTARTPPRRALEQAP
jgi:hypothetical protein